MRNTQHGFTVLELMTALAVVGVLVALAAPSFKQSSGNSRTAAAANSLVSALAVARSEALLRSTLVSICASPDGQTCANTTDWGAGWIAFVDNTGTPGTLDPNDKLIQAWAGPGGNVAVSFTAAKNYIQFDARGMNKLGAVATFKTWFPSCVGNNRTQIVVTVAGSPQSTKIACP
jgi:type IV fimbrial biogenesis protein FimT